MFNRLIVIALWAVVASTATCAQIAEGTFIAVNYTNDILIVAADSRTIMEPSGLPGPDACKITQLGKASVFFAMGKTSSDVGQFDALTLAQRAFNETSHALLPRTAEIWAGYMEDGYRRLFSVLPIAVLAPTPRNQLSSSVFADIEGTKPPLFLYTRVFHSEASQGPLQIDHEIYPPVPPRSRPIQSFGQEDYVDEFLANATERARAMNARVTASGLIGTERDALELQTLVEAVIDWAQR